jgi:hypothetical protein
MAKETTLTAEPITQPKSVPDFKVATPSAKPGDPPPSEPTKADKEPKSPLPPIFVLAQIFPGDGVKASETVNVHHQLGYWPTEKDAEPHAKRHQLHVVQIVDGDNR